MPGDEANPYRSPITLESAPNGPADDPWLPQRFRLQMHIVGGLWLVVAALAVAAALLPPSGAVKFTGQFGRVPSVVGWLIGVPCAALAVLTLLKHVWAVCIGLILALVLLFLSLVTILSLSGAAKPVWVVALAAIVVLSFRCVNDARRLAFAGQAT